MFIDELKIHIKAGDGGDGVVRWRREKFRPKGGPSGGNGGRGGDVYVKAVRDTGLLAEYKHRKEFQAENGEVGRGKSEFGKNGEDLIIDFPIGSIITNLGTQEVYELLQEGEVKKILQGGSGGLGNEHFKGAENQRPEQWTPGKPGEEGEFFIELQLVVDAGFVGFPNAGKSSLLNSLTNARSKVGAYQFTTLGPHLGDLYGFVLADIPGLIKGASEGKGLGFTFLRHIKRTRGIIHCVSSEEEDVVSAYKTIRNELEVFDASLTEKPELVVLTKTDVLSEDEVKEKISKLNEAGITVIPTTILDDDIVKKLSDEIISFLRSLD
jgi:GTPase